MKTLLVLCAALAVVVGSCPYPPRLWCSSPDIAEQCGVTRQCFFSGMPPVSVDLYYESLCPGCRSFITKQLYPTWQSIGDVMNVTLVPYGNAKERMEGGKWVFTCQHGPDECAGNLIETCAIHVLGDIKKYFPFINCIETSSAIPDDAAPVCAKKLMIDYNKIDACTKSTIGNQLQHGMATKTDALQPPHKYTPWIVVNGVHTEKLQEEAQSDLLKLVCRMYKGTKPAACTASRINVCLR